MSKELKETKIMSQGLKETKNNEVVELDIFEGSDTGFEGTDAQTFKTPFLKILQVLSPELRKKDPKHIPEAELGMFCNSATQHICNEISVVVLKVEHSLIVWKPQRGGFVGRFPKFKEKDIVARQEGAKKWDAEGNIVMDTIEFFCMDANHPSNIFIFPVSSASLKYGKSFATRLRMLTANGLPVNVSWAGIWKISTVEESNDQGSWFTLGATPEFVRFINREEKDNFIKPAKEMLDKAETDYAIIDAKEDTVDENIEF